MLHSAKLEKVLPVTVRAYKDIHHFVNIIYYIFVRIIQFSKNNVLYLVILDGDLCSNFSYCVVPQISFIIRKTKKVKPKTTFFKKTAFL